MSKKGGVPENLKPCKPGETHNPNGRPKGRKNISTYLKEFLQATESTELNSEPMRAVLENLKKAGFDCGSAALAYNMYKLALDKDTKPELRLKATESILDRMEGKPVQKTELTGKDGETLAIESTIYNELNKLPADKVGRIVDILEDRK